jgi:hypothetical protein
MIKKKKQSKEWRPNCIQKWNKILRDEIERKLKKMIKKK